MDKINSFNKERQDLRNLNRDKITRVIDYYLKAEEVEMELNSETSDSNNLLPLLLDGKYSIIYLGFLGVMIDVCNNKVRDSDVVREYKYNVISNTVRELIVSDCRNLSGEFRQIFINRVNKILNKEDTIKDKEVIIEEPLNLTEEEITEDAYNDSEKVFNILSLEYVRGRISDSKWETLEGNSDLEKCINWLESRRKVSKK